MGTMCTLSGDGLLPEDHSNRQVALLLLTLASHLEPCSGIFRESSSPASSLQNPGETKIGGSVGGSSREDGCLIPPQLGSESIVDM